jgi:hypothetical protein
VESDRLGDTQDTGESQHPTVSGNVFKTIRRRTMRQADELERVLVGLLKALDTYQRHGEMVTDKYKNALLDAKIEAKKVLSKPQGESK